jgi:acyl carrier protein
MTDQKTSGTVVSAKFNATASLAAGAKVTDPEQVLVRMCHLAAEEVGMDPAEVTPDSSLEADLNFDSLDKVNYALNIEEEFAVPIPDAEAEKVKTPRQAAEAVLAALKAAGE